MFRLESLVFFLLFAIAFRSVESAQSDLDFKLDIVKNSSSLFNWNQNNLISLIKSPAIRFESSKLLLNYTLGNRVNGDRVVATKSANQTFGSAQDVKLTLAYPASGVGAIVTYVQVLVEQSTNLGRGYITSGGIGQRNITVVIEAQKTLYFKYTASIFGY